MKIEEKQAISLIVLVITVIVLSILAATVILSISNTDIISESKIIAFKSDMTTYNDMYDMYVIEKILKDVTFDESSLTLTYKDSEYENVFGNVPDKYKEGLKVINGKLVYETSNEREKEIIEELGLVADKIKIITRLTNCTSSSSVTGVEYNSSYSTTITANTGYTLQKVAVVMNGVDVTSSVYTQSSGKINISKVTGKVIITATTDINTYAVTQNLTNVSSTNDLATAKHGTSFTTTLSEYIGHTLGTVKATMSGTDITESAYDSNTKTIAISYVTGDVIISASANSKVYTITNNLTDVTTSNTNTNTTYGKTYTAVLTPSEGYEIKEVTVTVDGTDVTNSAYNATTKTINLNSVVGDVVVYAVAEEPPLVSYTSEGVPIPKGFYVVGGTKDTGLVISDSAADVTNGLTGETNGNQFVWVPVDYTATGVEDDNGLDTGFTAVFVRGSADSTTNTMTGTLDTTTYIEPYESNSWEVEEYNAMCKSVETYGGFYIARFEAGDGDATEARTGLTKAHAVVSKKNAYVYNYVPWGLSMSNITPSGGTYSVRSLTSSGTVTSGTTTTNVAIAGSIYLSQQMYADSTSVVSTLCYGVQWDATMNFVSDVVSITDSTTWGNHSDSTGDAATNSGSLQKTGTNEAWQVKNIYDLAGNVWEMTMEEYSSKYRVRRGGAAFSSGSGRPAFYRIYDAPTTAAYYKGFRPTLYIVVD